LFNTLYLFKFNIPYFGRTYVLDVFLFEGDGSDIQLALAEWTGLKTVPNVFIGGKHIGGCDSKPLVSLLLFSFNDNQCLESLFSSPLKRKQII
jgi:hypothetical protein